MKTSCKPQSILYPQPVLVIASYDKEGHADAMVAAWGGIYDTNQIGFMLDAGGGRNARSGQAAPTTSLAKQHAKEQ